MKTDQIELFKQLAHRVRGMHKTAARRLVESNGGIFRVTCQDGMYITGATDRRQNRVNVETVDDIVTDSSLG